VNTQFNCINNCCWNKMLAV